MATKWIQTSTGRAVDLLGPDPIGMTLEEYAHSLSRINRYTGHTLGDEPYSVAQHLVLCSYNVASGDEFEALVHDMHEAVVGDVTSPVKNAMREINGGLPTPWDELEELAAIKVRCEVSVPVEMRASVVKADLDALLTERRDLLGDFEARPWGIPGEPWPEKIVPWDHRTAKQRFIERFLELIKSR